MINKAEIEFIQEFYILLNPSSLNGINYISHWGKSYFHSNENVIIEAQKWQSKGMVLCLFIGEKFEEPSNNLSIDIDKIDKTAIFESGDYQDWSSIKRNSEIIKYQETNTKISLFLEAMAEINGIMKPLKQGKIKSLQRTKDILSDLFESVEFREDNSFWHCEPDYVITTRRKPI